MRGETIEDLVKDAPCRGKGWCFLRELALHSGLNDRMVEQMRLIYDYKFIQSKIEGHDIGLQRAGIEFAANYAAKYSEVWRDGITHEELRAEVFPQYKPL